MATLNSQVIGRAGLTPALGAANSGGDKFTPGEDTYLEVKNGSGAPITVTVVTPKEVKGLAVADLAVSVPAAGTKKIGPFPDSEFRDPADGLASITYSGVTSLTIGAFKLGS